MELEYKESEVVIPPRLAQKRETLYKFSDIFNNINDEDIEQNNEYNLQLILDQIETAWISRDNEFDPFPLPPKIELVSVLGSLKDIFSSYSEKPEIYFLDSFYHFIVSAFQSNNDVYIIEFILNIILKSNCDYNDILSPFFANIGMFLLSNYFSILDIIEICNRFVFNNNFFNILYENQIHKVFITVIQSCADPIILREAFYFLNDYIIQILKLNGKDSIIIEQCEILEMTLLFIRTNENRDEFLPPAFLILNTFFKLSNPAFLEKAIEFGLIDIFSSLLHKKNPEVFLASSRLLNEFWPNCSLFNEEYMYERFKSIIEKQEYQNGSADFEMKDPILEKIQIIGFDVLRNMVQNHYDQFCKYDIINFILNHSYDYSFHLKMHVSRFLLDFMTFSSVQTRRDLMANYLNGTNIIAENAINLINDAIESENPECIAITTSTIIVMIRDDPEFWIELVSSTNMIYLFENIDDEKLKKIIQPLLDFYYSYLQQQ